MKKLITLAALAALTSIAPMSASAFDIGGALTKANQVSDALSGKPPAPTAAETATNAASNLLAGGDITTQLISAMQNPNVQSAVVNMLSADQISTLITQFPELLTLAQ